MVTVSNRLGKIQKHIAKKKGKNAALHEYSRDNRRLQSAAARDVKLNKYTKLRERENSTYLLRVKSFQDYTMEHTSPLTVAEIQAMIEDYLGRDDEELTTLHSERRAGRPPSTRETLLKQNQQVEQGEYASGFWVPDLEDLENLEILKTWTGRWAGLATLKFCRIAKDGNKKESSFPPKGLS